VFGIITIMLILRLRRLLMEVAKAAAINWSMPGSPAGGQSRRRTSDGAAGRHNIWDGCEEGSAILRAHARAGGGRGN